MGLLFNTGYYTEHDLRGEGFRSLGRNVRIAKNCTIVGAENISIGNDVHIGGSCTILAQDPSSVTIGSFVDIGTYVFLAGGDGIVLGDFCTLAQRVSIFSRSDDYSGRHLVGRAVPDKFKGRTRGTVRLERHALIGCSSVILPGVTVGEGSSVGALSLVKKDLPPWGVYCGCPTRKLQNRSKDLLELEKRFLQEIGPESPSPLRGEAA
jgi:galactoside O-acetyltransferase